MRKNVIMLAVLVAVFLGFGSARMCLASDIIESTLEIGNALQLDDWSDAKTIVLNKKTDPIIFDNDDGISAKVRLMYSTDAWTVRVKMSIYSEAGVELKSWTKDILPKGANWTNMWTWFTTSERLDVGHYQLRFTASDLTQAGAVSRTDQVIKNFEVVPGGMVRVVATTGATIKFNRFNGSELVKTSALKATDYLHTVFDFTGIGVKHFSVNVKLLNAAKTTVVSNVSTAQIDIWDARGWHNNVFHGKLPAGTYYRQVFVTYYINDVTKKTTVRGDGGVDTAIVIAP